MKIYKHFLLTLIVALFLSCGSTPIQKAITIEQTDSDIPLIIRASRKHKEITIINVPIAFSVKNSSFSERSFSNANYVYRKKYSGGGAPLYTRDKNNIALLREKSARYISAKSKNEYAIYSSHYIDTTEVVQKMLEPYLEKILKSNKDTLSISSLGEFKKKNSKFLKMLMSNDTLSINFNDFKRTKDWIPIKIPIKI